MADVPAPGSDTVSPSTFVITNADWTSRHYPGAYLIVVEAGHETSRLDGKLPIVSEHRLLFSRFPIGDQTMLTYDTEKKSNLWRPESNATFLDSPGAQRRRMGSAASRNAQRKIPLISPANYSLLLYIRHGDTKEILLCYLTTCRILIGWKVSWKRKFR